MRLIRMNANIWSIVCIAGFKLLAWSMFPPCSLKFQSRPAKTLLKLSNIFPRENIFPYTPNNVTSINILKYFLAIKHYYRSNFGSFDMNLNFKIMPFILYTLVTTTSCVASIVIGPMVHYMIWPLAFKHIFQLVAIR